MANKYINLPWGVRKRVRKACGDRPLVSRILQEADKRIADVLPQSLAKRLSAIATISPESILLPGDIHRLCQEWLCGNSAAAQCMVNTLSQCDDVESFRTLAYTAYTNDVHSILVELMSAIHQHNVSIPYCLTNFPTCHELANDIHYRSTTAGCVLTAIAKHRDTAVCTIDINFVYADNTHSNPMDDSDYIVGRIDISRGMTMIQALCTAAELIDVILANVSAHCVDTIDDLGNIYQRHGRTAFVKQLVEETLCEQDSEALIDRKRDDIAHKTPTELLTWCQMHPIQADVYVNSIMQAKCRDLGGLFDVIMRAQIEHVCAIIADVMRIKKRRATTGGTAHCDA